MTKAIKTACLLSILALYACLSPAYASAGEIFSGIAFINPAEYTSVKKQQLTFSAVWLIRNVRFSGSVTRGGFFPIDRSGTASNIKPLVFLPDFSYVVRLTHKLVISFRRTNPFNVESDYGQSFLEAVATVTDLHAVNYSTSLAYAVTPKLSVAAGIDVQNLSADLSSIEPGFGRLNISGQNWGVGAHAGFILKVTPITILSLVYYSPVHHLVRGTVTLGDNPATQDRSDATASVTLPANTTLSLIQILSHHFGLMFSATYTNWSVVQELAIKNDISKIVLPTGYRNTFYFQLGGRYVFNKKWYLQGGVSYDRTASNNADRSVRLPGDNVIGIVIGAHYQPNKYFGISLDYGHGFVGKVPINTTQNGITTKGTAHVMGNVVALKITVGH